MTRFSAFLVVCAAGTLAACGAPEPADEGENAASASQAETQTPAEAAAADIPGHLDTSAAITEADFHYRISSLADDRFEGRGPGSEKGELAADWIAEEMNRAGLEPAGENGGWFQDVPLVESELVPGQSSLDITVNGEAMGLAYGQDAVYWTENGEERVAIDATEMVFVGYGVVAPEYGWNDYEGLDVEGKTVVMLVNDPGFANPDGDAFNGRAMTYFGRWTYKYEEAARQGAAGAIVVHQTEPASYPWAVVQSSWTGPQFTLRREGELVPVQGWIQLDVARRLFNAVGEDFDALAAAAAEPGFEPVPLDGALMSASLTTRLENLSTRNVAGVARGSQRPEEYVLYMAHWDHLGMRLNFAEEDQVYNGAVDNASGTAAILEIAQAFANQETPPERSVIFVAVGAEEQGLLGSAWYAENPLVPLDQTVGGFNFDSMPPVGRAEDMVVIGSGASELEDLLRAEAEARGRYLSPDPTPQAGYFYRSDHVSLARVGVPMLYSDGGSVLVEGGADAFLEWDSEYRANRYHKPADEYDPDWDMSGLVADSELMYAVGRSLADSEDWPNWYPGNEFRSLRDAMMEGME